MTTSFNIKRWSYAFIGATLLLLLGLIYAWSVFVAPLEAEFAWSRSETSMAFTICMCTFCLGGLTAGFLSRKYPFQLALRLCAVFVFCGFILTSRISTLSGLYISYGAFVGFGVGLAYNAIISTITKWFPDQTGLISGILLMGFGLGGMILGTFCSSLMSKIGWRNTFIGIGVIYFLIIIIASFVLKAPTKDTLFPISEKKETKGRVQTNEYTTGEMLKNHSFWMFFIWAVCLSAAGLSLIGHASPCAVEMGFSTSKAAFLAGLISIFNGTGRVLMGALFDRLGRKTTMCIVSFGFILSGILLASAIYKQNTYLLIAGYITTGFSYGGIMPCNSTVISQFYGRTHYSMNFSMINMNILISSPLGPYMAGLLYGKNNSYFSTFVLMAMFGIVAFILNLFITKPKKINSLSE